MSTGQLQTNCSVITPILDRFLDLLSLILSGQTYKPLGAPTSLGRSDMTTRDLNATQVSQVLACILFFLLTLLVPSSQRMRRPAEVSILDITCTLTHPNSVSTYVNEW